MNDIDYIRKLENVLGCILQPLKDIPFKLVIKALGGVNVLEFDKKLEANKKLLNLLIEVADEAKNKINKKGINSQRVNEVGNKVEPFVKDSFQTKGIEANTPVTKYGQRKSTGYPDIEFKDKNNQWHYLECKTFNKANLETTQRSFYISPSKNFKVMDRYWEESK